MSTYHFIEKLQKKSDREKKRILTGLTIASTVLLLVGGFLSFRATLRNQQNAFVSGTTPSATVFTEDGSTESLRGPFASLKDGLVLVAGDITEKVGALAEDVRSERTPESVRPYVPLPVE